MKRQKHSQLESGEELRVIYGTDGTAWTVFKRTKHHPSAREAEDEAVGYHGLYMSDL